ncbi:hypothetical protein MMC21_007744 [Puttea exsequens]|nr:hypothetical protein [Puttea exsequens]
MSSAVNVPPPPHPPTYINPYLSHLTSITPTQQVLRYSALGAGVGYGLYHQAAIRAKIKVQETDTQYAHQQSLIRQAKSEWAKKTLPKEKTDASVVITDPADPKFDLEAFLTLKGNEL